MNRRASFAAGWLANVSHGTMEEEPFPLRDILHHSVYYPASGFDGGPVKNLAGCLFSFVYVDNGICSDISRASLDRELEERGFWGYRIVGRREVSREELFPRRHLPMAIHDLLTDRQGEDWVRYLPLRGEAPFFCEWLVFERLADFGHSHGPLRFSWLFVCAEGVRTFISQYVANSIAPAAVAIIQSGMGMPLEQFDGLFARCVLANPDCRPGILLLGGRGAADRFREMCWPGYRRPCIHEWECIQRKERVRPHDNCRDVCDDAVLVDYDYREDPPAGVLTSTTVWLKDA